MKDLIFTVKLKTVLDYDTLAHHSPWTLVFFPQVEFQEFFHRTIWKGEKGSPVVPFPQVCPPPHRDFFL